MGAGTTLLPQGVQADQVPSALFPVATEAAMVRGVIQSMVTLVQDAQRSSGASLWLCGGMLHCWKVSFGAVACDFARTQPCSCRRWFS